MMPCWLLRLCLLCVSGNGEAKVSLVAILCCVGLDDDVEMPSEEFKALPLMLVKGPATLTEHLIQWLQVRPAAMLINSKFLRAIPFECTWGQGLSRNASSVSFGHAEHCFLTVWTPKCLCQDLLKMAFLRR